MQTPGPGGAAHTRRGKMRRIVVSLLKGGVAKSETAVSLAHGLSMKGLRVLLVDTDVQAQCNDMLGLDPKRGLADVIAGWTSPEAAMAEARENLFLLAGGNELAAVKMEIARREMAPEAVLDEALSTLEDDFDAMVIDTAPGWDTLLVNALYASREVLSPVSMEPMALTGLIRFEERLAIIQKYNPRLALRWVVPTFVDGRVRKTGEIMAQLSERYGERLAPPIKYSVKLSEAPAFGKTIYEHDPKGAAAACYQQLTERVLADLMADAQPEARPRLRPEFRPFQPSPAPVSPTPPDEPVILETPAKSEPAFTPAPEVIATSAAPPRPPATPAPSAAAVPMAKASTLELVRPAAQEPAPEPAPAERPLAPWGGKAVQGLRARLEGQQQPGQPAVDATPERPVLAGGRGPAERPAAVSSPFSEVVHLEALAVAGETGVHAASAEESPTDYGLMDRAIKEIRERLGKYGRS